MRTRVREVTHEGARVREDRLATEEPLEIRLSAPGLPARRIWVTMRTPGHDFELATGYLLHEGVIAPELLDRVAYCTDVALTPEQEFNVVTVTLSGAPLRLPEAPSPGATTGSSACGVCGSDAVDRALAGLGRAASGLPRHEPPDDEVIFTLPDTLREQQRVFESTGGLHAAGLFDASGRALVVREDIGRHNAVDKVTGARVLAGKPSGDAVLVVSGRAGFELVQKAAAAGVGTLVAVGAPSSLAVDLARTAGLGLVGFTSRDRFVRYTATP